MSSVITNIVLLKLSSFYNYYCAIKSSSVITNTVFSSVPTNFAVKVEFCYN